MAETKPYRLIFPFYLTMFMRLPFSRPLGIICLISCLARVFDRPLSWVLNLSLSILLVSFDQLTET